MSARKPFFPALKTPSRSSQTGDDAHASTTTATNTNSSDKTIVQFSVDLSNPLHFNAKTSSSTSNLLQNVSVIAEAPGQAYGPGHATLITSNRRLSAEKSLPKKTPSLNSTPSEPHNNNQLRRPSVSGSTIIRPGTADPNLKSVHQNYRLKNPNHSHSLKIVAPVPRQASTLALSSNGIVAASTSSAFKTPAAPSSPAQFTSHDRQSSLSDTDNAHTPTFSFGKLSNDQQLDLKSFDAQLPTPDVSFSDSFPHSHSHSHTAEHQEIQEIQVVQDQRFRLNMSLPNHSGPAQRVLRDSDMSSRNRAILEENEIPEPAKIKSTKKRTRDEDGDGDDYNGPATNRQRSRMSDNWDMPDRDDEVVHQEAPPVSPSAHRTIHDQGSSRQHRDYDYHGEDDDHDLSQDRLPHRDVFTIHDGPSARSALDKLLDRDTDEFIEAHIEQYERSMEKWRNCEAEEWTKGAEQLKQKYCKILDFVKDHMTSKLNLYATFNTNIDAHNVLLAEREKVLEGVRERLVVEGGLVLGV